MKRHLLLAEFASQYWAITPDRLGAIASVLARWTAGEQAAIFVRESVAADVQAARERKESLPKQGNLAVIPVYGIIAQRQVQDVSGPGMASTQSLVAQIKQAITDNSISQILLDFDGPGGTVYGIPEAAAEIRVAKEQKPITALANSLCASAAFWLASQASQFFCTPSGEVGSIGIYSTHEYIGEALKKQGVDITLLSAGEYKTEGNPFEPLSDAAKTYQPSRIKDYYQAFVDDVAIGRKTTSAAVIGNMGQGRVLGAEAAKSAGMIDGIISYNDLVIKLTAQTQPQTRNRRAAAERRLALAQLQ